MALAWTALLLFVSTIVGSVLGFDQDELEIKFMMVKEGKRNVYVAPGPGDMCWVDRDQVVSFLHTSLIFSQNWHILTQIKILTMYTGMRLKTWTLVSQILEYMSLGHAFAIYMLLIDDYYYFSVCYLWQLVDCIYKYLN